MSYQRVAYEDQDSAERMKDDCAACGDEITLPGPGIDASAATMPAPPLQFENDVRADHSAEITVSDAAAHLAAGLHLHLD